MPTVRYEIDYLEDFIRDAINNGDSTVEIEVELDAYQVEDAVDYLSDYYKQNIFEKLIAEGHAEDREFENPAWSATAMIRYRRDVLGLDQDMTVEDALHQIEEAIK